MSPCVGAFATRRAGDGVARQIAGMIFDGQYVYPVPTYGQIGRFLDKSPPSLPPLPEVHGSFF